MSTSEEAPSQGVHARNDSDSMSNRWATPSPESKNPEDQTILATRMQQSKYMTRVRSLKGCLAEPRGMGVGVIGEHPIGPRMRVGS